MSGVPVLRKFSANNAGLSGTVPASLGQATALTYLNLNTNQLTGTLPSSLGDLVNLTMMDFGNNRISGTLPPSLGQLSNLKRLYLNVNELSGTLPETLSGMTSLSVMYLYRNQFISPLPDLSRYSHGHPDDKTFWTGLYNLKELFLFDNLFNEPLPSHLTDMSDTLTSLSLGGNAFYDVIPVEYMYSFAFLSLDGNQLSGGIPDISEFMRQSDTFKVSGTPVAINLANNPLLSGTVPESIGKFFFHLQILDISNSSLSGALPPNLGDNTILAQCSLSGGSNNFACPRACPACALAIPLQYR
jgi:Leucine-rich repeat (LRR) protein